MDLYLFGGEQKRRVANPQQDWLLFERAVLCRVDAETGQGSVEFDYQPPLDLRASPESSVMFKSGSLVDGRLYACTSTDVVVLDARTLQPSAHISLPFFNDLHHVAPTPRGTLTVAVTGLDMVAELSLEGELIQCWSAIGEDPWARFSPSTDYRKVPTLKPYRAHANFVFWPEDRPWVTRGDLGDAVCLTDLSRRIDLGTKQCVHDGVVAGERIFFTSVDGFLYVVDRYTLQVERSIDLNALGPEGHSGYSWCRGVLPLYDGLVWVGFSRIRQTQWKEKVRWIKGLVSGVSRPTRLVLYDWVHQRQLREINLEPLGMHAVFNAVPAPAVARNGDDARRQAPVLAVPND